MDQHANCFPQLEMNMKKGVKKAHVFHPNSERFGGGRRLSMAMAAYIISAEHAAMTMRAKTLQCRSRPI
jgi:hypothetical protein